VSSLQCGIQGYLKGGGLCRPGLDPVPSILPMNQHALHSSTIRRRVAGLTSVTTTIMESDPAESAPWPYGALVMVQSLSPSSTSTTSATPQRPTGMRGTNPGDLCRPGA
jgi:hypothetical protein